MNRLAKAQEFDSYEIEEPSDEERAGSRSVHLQSLAFSLAFRRS